MSFMKVTYDGQDLGEITSVDELEAPLGERQDSVVWVGQDGEEVPVEHTPQVTSAETIDLLELCSFGGWLDRAAQTLTQCSKASLD